VIERNARAQARTDRGSARHVAHHGAAHPSGRAASGPVRGRRAALETLRPAIEAKALVVETALDRKAHPITGDPSRLQQIVWNLLSNAIKFTPHGGKVRVALKRVNFHIEISVADTGSRDRAGVPAARLRAVPAGGRLDYAAPRGARPGTDDCQASGRASLAARCAQSAQGKARARPLRSTVPLAALHRATGEEERGHPTAAALDPVAAAVSGPVRPRSSSRSTTRPDARDLVQRVLENCGARVVTADGMQEALVVAEGERPHVLVCDIGMPDADGFDVLRQLRAMALTSAARFLPLR
jgi:hypothetical protein